jgi:hypothetical protein
MTTYLGAFRVLMVFLALVVVSGQPPSTAQSSITYVGSFRLPIAPGDAHFSFAGAFVQDLSTPRLAMMSRLGHVVLLQPPTTAVYAGAVNTLPIVGYDSVINPPSGKPTGTGFYGALLNNDAAIMWTASLFYDANNTQTQGHWYNGEWRTVHSGATSLPNPMQGFIAGSLIPVPTALRPQMGQLISSQCCLPVISRTSLGPTVFGLFLADFIPAGNVPTLPLVYYTQDHPTLGEYFSESLGFNQTARVFGGTFIGEELIFVGAIGVSGFCYGNGTTNPALHLTVGGDGELLCYDPEMPPDKGGHASVYRYQVWRYQVADILAASNPWDVIPVTAELPQIMPGPRRVAGVASLGTTLYVSQYNAENTPRAGGYPVGHAFQVLPLAADEPGPVRIRITPP